MKQKSKYGIVFFWSNTIEVVVDAKNVDEAEKKAFDKFKDIVKNDKHFDEWEAINCYNYDKGDFEWVK